MTTEELTPAEVRRAALSAYRADCCVVVVKEDGSKYPDLQEWKEYTRKRPDEALLKMWYSGNRTGMGLICGAVSGNLETFEFDDQPTYLMFKALAIASGLGDLVARIEEGYSEQSPNGIHWLTRCSEVGGNIKLARRLKRPEEMKDPNDKIKTLIETRGNGGFIITAPSYGKVHPTGQPYRLLHGGFDSIATITPEERAGLFELARTFDQMPRQIAPEPPDKGAGKSGGRPGDDFNARADWGHLLESHGWRLVFERNGTGYWRRPGKDRGISATTNYQDSDLLYVFSTSTPFEELRGYSKFSAYALLEHGGDFKAAATALAGLGYGQSNGSKSSKADPSDFDKSGSLDSDPDTEEVRMHITPLQDVVPEKVAPLWPKRIFRGKLAVMAGDPGMGKSYASLDIAARVSLGGPWPDGSGNAPKGNVLLLSAEDGLADTIKPRLELLGADMSRIFSLGLTVHKAEEDKSLSLQQHLPLIEREILEKGIILLVVDPLLAFTGKADTHKTAEVRGLLSPIAAMAGGGRRALFSVIHPNKNSSETNLIYRISASLDFAAAARSVMVVAKHPDNPDQRVMATVKCNLSAHPEPMAFGFTHDGCFAWRGVTELDMSRLMASADREDSSALDEAKQFLQEVLADGEMPARDVLGEARECSIHEKTLRRAVKDLGIDVVRVGEQGKKGGGRWVWRLPPGGQ